MDADVLNKLLHQAESETLDFKRDQYAFEGAGNDAKSELLKDILAFANAWKTTQAHILIGVQEQQGAKAQAVGIKAQLDDAKLQQFVNEKTNKPIKLCYSVVPLGSLQIGVIEIDGSQARPVFLKRDFGKLRKNVVYIRRGSSTSEASPDEIAEMGAERVATTPAPSVEVEFADTGNRQRLGTDIAITSTLLVDPPPPTPKQMREVFKELKAAKLLETPLTRLRLPTNFLDPLRGQRPTPQQVRQARQEFALLTSVGFWVRNCGAVTANDVRIAVHGSQVDGLRQLDELNHPKNRMHLGLGRSAPGVFRSDVRIEEHGTDWTLSIDVGKLQPKSEVWITDQWYLGSPHALRLDLEATIFADDLPHPITTPLAIAIRTTERVYREADFEGAEDE